MVADLGTSTLNSRHGQLLSEEPRSAGQNVEPRRVLSDPVAGTGGSMYIHVHVGIWVLDCILLSTPIRSYIGPHIGYGGSRRRHASGSRHPRYPVGSSYSNG